MSVKKWNLVIDVAACHNCHNCFIAAKDEHVGNDIPGYAAPQPLHGHRWIDIRTQERGRAPHLDAAHLPTMCNHCDDAPCVKVAEASRSYDLPPSEIETWIDEAKRGMENALRANPLDIREQYEKQIKQLQEAYGEAMLELRARKKLQSLLGEDEK